MKKTRRALFVITASLILGVSAPTNVLAVEPITTAAVPVSTSKGRPACAGPSTSQPTGLVAHARPVVLVHGWTGTAMQDTRAALEDRMPAGWQFLLFDYYQHSTLWADAPEVAGCFSQYLRTVSEAHRTAGGNGIVYVVGHSMGGLATRFALAFGTGDVGLRNRVGGVVTLNTPHLGSPWGGTNWALIASSRSSFAGTQWAFPGESNATTCLAAHSLDNPLPAGCASAPLLPPWVPIHQVAGSAVITRSFFGLGSYDMHIGGDGIVDNVSQQGYLQSALPDDPGIRARGSAQVIECRRDSGNLLRLATPSGVAAEFAWFLAAPAIDIKTMDSLAAGRADVYTAATAAFIALTMECAHTQLPTAGRAMDAVAEQLRGWASAEDASEPPTIFQLPAVCDLPPARWLNGRHPDGTPNTTGGRGDAWIDQRENVDVTGDGRKDWVIRTACDFGGNHVVYEIHAMGHAGEYLERLNVEEFVPSNRDVSAGIGSVEPDGTIVVPALGFTTTDADCCPSIKTEVRFKWDGARFVGESDFVGDVEVEEGDQPPLPALDADFNTGLRIAGLLRAAGVDVYPSQVRLECSIIQVLGGDLDARDLDVVFYPESGDCAGDAVGLLYRVRSEAITATAEYCGCFLPEEMEQFYAVLDEYKERTPTVFFVSPADHTWDLLPAR